MVRWSRWHCPPDTGFEIRALAVWGRARYLSVTEAPHNTDFHTWMGKKHFCFFQTAETGNRTPSSGVKGSVLTTTLGPRPPLIERDVKHPICTFWWLLTSDSDVKSRQTKNERNAKTVTMATSPLSTMRSHRSLGIFVIIFTRFSLISQSILNRFSFNFAGTTCNYSGDCSEKFVKFERVFLKLLVRLVVNLLEYFKIYSFRRQFRHQFSTVYHVILQAPLDGTTATAL